MLKECLRQYYYHTYGSWGGWSDRADQATRLIYLAKKSDNLASYMGTFIHDANRRILTWMRAGRPVARDRAVARVEEKMREDIEYSKSGKWREVPPSKATLILHSHITGEDLHENEVRDIIQRAQTCMGNFFDMVLPDLIASGSEHWVTIDSLDYIKVNDFSCFMVPDLVHTQTLPLVWEGMSIVPGTMVITDWKTGFSTDVEQLAIYGVYMSQQSDIHLRPHGPIVGRSVPLLDPSKTAWREIGAHDIEEKMEKIVSDIAAMLPLIEPGRAKDKSFFPKTEHRGICKSCRYAFFCYRDD